MILRKRRDFMLLWVVGFVFVATTLIDAEGHTRLRVGRVNVLSQNLYLAPIFFVSSRRNLSKKSPCWWPRRCRLSRRPIPPIGLNLLRIRSDFKNPIS